MLNTWIRLLKDTTDVSLDNQGSGTITTDGTSPIFYLGKKAPFNNFFAWMDVANVNSLTMTVEYWDGKDWVPTVDLLDGSNAFTQSGVVQFSPDKDYGWQRVSDTTDAGEPPELSSFKIYDLYWLKISFSGDMSAGSTLKQIAYKFTDENELLLKDSDLNEFLTAFGLTDWTDHICSASIEVANDFKKKKLIKDEGQLLRFDDVTLPTVYKTLFNIYLNLGESYKERRKEIAELYEKAFIGIYTIDSNNDAVVSPREMGVESNRMYR